MKRVFGTKGVSLLECINPDKSIWRVRWDVQDIKDKENEVSYMEEEYYYRPSLSEIKNLILDWIDSDTNLKICNGFKWNEYDVRLTSEDQFNFKVEYDLAVQSNGANLPTTFKFYKDGYLVRAYHVFETLEELEDFYTKSVEYVKSILAEGWTKKDTYDFSAYE